MVGSSEPSLTIRCMQLTVTKGYHDDDLLHRRLLWVCFLLESLIEQGASI